MLRGSYKERQARRDRAAQERETLLKLFTGRLQPLIDILTKETQSLKVQYIEMTKKYAENYFQECCNRCEWNIHQWYKEYNIQLQEVLRNGATTMEVHPNEYHRKGLYRMYDEQRFVAKIQDGGLKNLMDKEVKSAEEHYVDSIQKLALRIDKKGLKIDKLTVKTSHIGVNIDTTLTDGEQTVKAFTIIAEGEIQRPHYRYLIK